MSGVGKNSDIVVKGARVNNLKNIDVIIRNNKFTCVTGVSGCGKSSLVYDTIYAESQRNFFESMSVNAYNQKIMDKPDVDNIENLRPALNVSQNYYNTNPRSTIGTYTELAHYLRTIFSLIVSQKISVFMKESVFSFNNPSSCCPRCKGLGEEYVVSMQQLIPDENKTLSQGAIAYFKGKDNSYEMQVLKQICYVKGINMNIPYSELPEKHKEILLNSKGDSEVHIKYKTKKGRYKQEKLLFVGAYIDLANQLLDIDTPSTFLRIHKYLEKSECKMCNGTRLNETVLSYRIVGSNIAEVEQMSLDEIGSWIDKMMKEYKNSSYIKQLQQLTTTINTKIDRLKELKLGYLSLSRAVPTLSGGEIQRVRIANQLTCSLIGLLYILDEPCKGLHYRDINSIINATRNLVSSGNTVIAIEHNKKYISEADSVMELGPVGGPRGGYFMKEYTPNRKYKLEYKVKGERREFNKFLKFEKIIYRTIQSEDVQIPINAITCVTGVSGSGKSTLVSVINDSIIKKGAIHCKRVSNLDEIKSIYFVNQEPIGKTPRSTVISYLGIYDQVRELFGNTELARKLNLSSSDFSMNVAGGRCEECQGTGYKKIELNYLPDSYIVCDTCNGKRFNDTVLSVKYDSYSIADVLNIEIEKIIYLFEGVPNVYSKLKCMIDIGLGYMKLGQMSMNLSGGEAQRIKLVKYLGANNKGNYLFVLDEPTSGLNDEDILKLNSILADIIKKGNTIIIVEHNIEFIANNADYIIDFGVCSGKKGGSIIAQDRPNEVLVNEKSSLYGLLTV